MKLPANRTLLTLAVAAAVFIFTLGYRWGHRSAQNANTEIRFQVEGQSMAPSFSGGDVCVCLPSDEPPQTGDVVAIEWRGKHRIKRVAAIGGDVVDRVDRRLTVNGRRIEDIIADQSTDRFTPPKMILVSSQSDDWIRSDVQTGWIVYGHRNPHQAGRITPVTDDYPVNQSVRRTLNDVARLAVEIRWADATRSDPIETELRVAFFGATQSIATTTTLQGLALSRTARRSVDPDSPWLNDAASMLDAAHPIAVEITQKGAMQYAFHVYREIEYRDDKPSGNVIYPLRVPDSDIFVVGDNVPISVDSRDFGPVPLSAIIGRIEP